MSTNKNTREDSISLIREINHLEKDKDPLKTILVLEGEIEDREMRAGIGDSQNNRERDLTVNLSDLRELSQAISNFLKSW